MIADSFAPVRDRIAAAVKSTLPPIEQVRSATVYASLPLTLDGVPESTADGLRPLGLMREAYRSLGTLALQLQVDGVIALELHWRLELNDRVRQVEVTLGLLIVGREGNVLWKETYLASSPLDAPGESATLLERVSLNETAVHHATFRALMSCLDQFQTRWQEQAALRSKEPVT